MFGVEKDRLVEALDRLRRTLCVRDPYPSESLMAKLLDHPPSLVCDCKYGVDYDNHEKNGCPEVRGVIELLRAMTPEEYSELARRAGVEIPGTDESGQNRTDGIKGT